MPNHRLREMLPSLLMYMGLASSALFVILAVFSFSNPLMMAALLSIGPGLGFSIWGLGVMIENSEKTRKLQEQVAADVRASTKATLGLIHELRSARNEA